MAWHKVTSGQYRTSLNGKELWIINHRHYTGKRSDCWNILIDNVCDEMAYSKREAQRKAEHMAYMTGTGKAMDSQWEQPILDSRTSQ